LTPQPTTKSARSPHSAAGAEVEPSGQRLRPRHGAEQRRAGRERVGQVHAAGRARLGSAAVDDQRIGGDRQHLEEHEEGEEVAGEGDAHGREQA
jgi:hypothetical protein